MSVRRDQPTGRYDALGREIKESSATPAYQASSAGLGAAVDADTPPPATPASPEAWGVEFAAHDLVLHPTRAAAMAAELPPRVGGLPVGDRRGNAVVRLEVDDQPIGWVVGHDFDVGGSPAEELLQRHGVDHQVAVELTTRYDDKDHLY